MQTCDPVIERANISNYFQKNMLLKKKLALLYSKAKTGLPAIDRNCVDMTCPAGQKVKISASARFPT